MKKWIAALGVAVVLSLSACSTKPAEPTVFGLPKSTWNTLSPSEKQQVIQGYNERQKINAQNAPIQDAVDAAQVYEQQKQQQKQWDDMRKDQPIIHMPQ